MTCLFCNIAEKKIPSRLIYEDDLVVAFHDIAPQAPHHILIIPKKHIATINDFENEDTLLLGHLMQTAKKIAADLGLSEKGFRLVMNCNDEGGQTVHHIHFHLLGGRQMHWPPG